MTKKQLGIGLITMGSAGLVGVLAVDWFGAGQFSGIGPTQRLGILAAGIIILIGLTLLPLGDRPA